MTTTINSSCMLQVFGAYQAKSSQQCRLLYEAKHLNIFLTNIFDYNKINFNHNWIWEKDHKKNFESIFFVLTIGT